MRAPVCAAPGRTDPAAAVKDTGDLRESWTNATLLCYGRGDREGLAEVRYAHLYKDVRAKQPDSEHDEQVIPGNLQREWVAVESLRPTPLRSVREANGALWALNFELPMQSYEEGDRVEARSAAAPL